MKTVLKNKSTALICAIAILLGVVSLAFGQPTQVFATQVTWEKADFEYKAEDEIIAFSEQGVEKAKTTKILSFPEGTRVIHGNYGYSHTESNRFEKEFGRGKVWDKVILPNSVQALGYAVFYDARIKEVQFSENLSSISGVAFFNNQISSITLPEKLVQISDNAFERNQLEEVTIPKSVKYIGNYAFSNNKLHTVNILGDTKVSPTGAFHKQQAIYRPEMNPFYENHFGYNGKINFENYEDVLSYKDGEYSFLNDDVDEVTLDFNADGTSYKGTMTIINSHKWPQGTQVEVETSDQATQTKSEIKVIYQYQDKTSYKEFRVLFDKGAVIDASDLEMLPDDMEFADDFMFYEVKGDGADSITRTVKKISSDSSTQTDEPSVSDQETQTQEPKTNDASTQTDLTMEDIKHLEDKTNQLDERLKEVESELDKQKDLSEEQAKKIDELKNEQEALSKENSKLQAELEEVKNNVDETKAKLDELEKRVAELEKKAKECLSVDVNININNEKPNEKPDNKLIDNDKKIESLEKKLAELIEKVNVSEKTVKENDTVNSDLKKTVDSLQSEKTKLLKEIETLKKEKTTSKDVSETQRLEKNYEELNKKLDELKKLVDQKSAQTTKTLSEGSTIKSNTKTESTPVKSESKPISNATVTKDNVSTSIPKTADSSTYNSKEEKEVPVRYPNKLTPKPVADTTNATSSNASSSNTADAYYGNKTSSSSNGAKTSTPVVKSSPSKANASVTENVNNANGDYPIHREGEASEAYSADARQFVEFQTKSGKVFYLIINHDEQTENVLLLTEVSEGDLLNMVESKEEEKAPVKEVEKAVEKAEPEKTSEETKEPVKEEPKSGIGSYLILFLVIGAVIGGGYYFKVVKAKEKQELQDLEEPDDYIVEASDSNDEDQAEAEEYEEADEDEDIIL